MQTGLTEAEKCGVLMLIWLSHPPRPDYHAMSNSQLWSEIFHRRKEAKIAAAFVDDCKRELAEAERQHKYFADQLELCEGIMDVRALIRREANG
jgi:hypothetical protein